MVMNDDNDDDDDDNDDDDESLGHQRPKVSRYDAYLILTRHSRSVSPKTIFRREVAFRREVYLPSNV